MAKAVRPPSSAIIWKSDSSSTEKPATTTLLVTNTGRPAVCIASTTAPPSEPWARCERRIASSRWTVLSIAMPSAIAANSAVDWDRLMPSSAIAPKLSAIGRPFGSTM